MSSSARWPSGPRGDGRPVTVAGFITAQRQITASRTRPAAGAVGRTAWFYKWRDGNVSPRRARRAQLAITIRQLFAAHHGKYVRRGSPMICARPAGQREDRREDHARAATGRSREEAAQAHHPAREGTVAGTGPDRRDFPASTLNRKWYGDGTEILTDEGEIFLTRCWTWFAPVVGSPGRAHDTELAHSMRWPRDRGGREAIAG